MRQIQGKGRDKEHLAVFWGTNTHGLARRLCLRNPWLPCFTPVQYYDGIWHRDRARLHKSTHVSVRVYPRMCLKTAAFEGPSNGDTVLLCVRQTGCQFFWSRAGRSCWWSGANMQSRLTRSFHRWQWRRRPASHLHLHLSVGKSVIRLVATVTIHREKKTRSQVWFLFF